MKMRHQEKFAFRVKTRLMQEGRTITDLARQISRPRTSVSQAINRDRFPRIQKAIRKSLAL